MFRTSGFFTILLYVPMLPADVSTPHSRINTTLEYCKQPIIITTNKTQHYEQQE
jgi:hypothetical protein